MSMRSLMSIHRVTIKVESVSRGAAGGMIRTWTSVATDVPCRVDPLPPDYELNRLGKEGFRADYKVYFPDNPNINEQHQLVYTDSDSVVHTLLVEKIENPHGLNRFWKVWCCENQDVDGTAA